MDTLVIDREHIAKLVQLRGVNDLMDRTISRLRQHLSKPGPEAGLSPARSGFERLDTTAILEWMPHHQPSESVTIKTVSYSPANPQQYGLPTITSVLTRFDDETGRLTALADGVFPTALRTGAASAVATELLARPSSDVLGLVGVGAQSITQAHALSRVCPLRSILVYDLDPARAASFAERVSFLPVDVRVAPLAEVESAADVICTATSVEVGAGPVLQGTQLREHVHINAIGADLPGKVEIPVGVLKRAVVVPDHVEQARREGECQQLADDQVAETLAALCTDPSRAHRYQRHITVFDSTGFALEDKVVLDVIVELAAAEGLGNRIAIEHLPIDPVNPYAL